MSLCLPLSLSSFLSLLFCLDLTENSLHLFILKFMSFSAPSKSGEIFSQNRIQVEIGGRKGQSKRGLRNTFIKIQQAQISGKAYIACLGPDILGKALWGYQCVFEIFCCIQSSCMRISLLLTRSVLVLFRVGPICMVFFYLNIDTFCVINFHIF